jgi:hypothetical protein
MELHSKTVSLSNGQANLNLKCSLYKVIILLIYNDMISAFESRYNANKLDIIIALLFQGEN